MHHRIWRILTLILVFSLIVPLVAFAAPVDPNTDALVQQAQASGGKRFIVQLEGAPLAVYYREMGAPMSMSRADGKLDVFSPEAQSYLAKLRRQREMAIRALERTIPGARVAEYVDEFGRRRPLTFEIVLNGFVVELPKADRQTLIKLSRIPGVKAVTVERQVELNMEVVNPTIGAPAVWQQLGGIDVAGEGIKVAVIDTGIDPNHPALDPTGYTYPVGYPKGDTRYTTPKVIVVRGVYRPDDPPVPPAPLPLHPHGTGVATIIGTNPNTVATYKGVDVTLSGVAPKVYLMSYQIFYPSAAGSSARYASDSQTVKAIEMMVADGADVVNNSWGETVFVPLRPGFNPVVDALEAAGAAGVVVVKSAGNSGRSGNATVGGNDQPVNGISVGATANTRAFGNEAKVTGPGEVPDILQSMLAVPADFGGTLTSAIEEVYVDVGRIHPGNKTACDPIDDPNQELAGKIALISRGACRFDKKVKNAQDAGAVLAIIYNNVPSAPPITMGGETGDITIPAFMVGNLQGLAMVEFENANPGEATVYIGTEVARITGVAPEDILTDFSSRGPAFPLNRIVPDIVAQGQNVLSGYGVTTKGPDAELWAPWAGTSASGPVVAGAAALIKAAHPDWAPWQIKSALMTTAKREVWLDYAQTTLGGPMEIGAGRVRVDKALDPGAFVRVVDPTGMIPDNQSAMFGLMQPGQSKTLDIEFHSAIGIDATWQVSVDTPFTLSVNLSSSTVNVPAGGMGKVSLTLDLPADMEPGDYWGYVNFSHGPHSGHIPFWVRVQAPEEGAEVLLIDDDGSFLQPIFFGVDTPDYRPYYEAMLQNLGVTYDVWDAEKMWLSGPGLPDIATLQKYDKVIWFTGDSFLTYFGVTADASDRVRLLDFFHNTPGRKLIVTGQDWSGYFSNFIDGADSGCVLCSLGVYNWAEDAYDPTKFDSPHPSAMGVGPFNGMLLDMGGVVTATLEAGAGNQGYIDGLYPDGPFSPEWGGMAAFRALVPPSEGSGESVPYIATLRSGEPRLEWFLRGDKEGLSTSDSRAIYFAFGLEGISNAHADKGFAKREDVLKRAFEWLDDEVSISVSGPGTVNASEIVTFTAILTSSMPYTQPISFRWSWGDGTPIQSSGSSNVAAHTYEEPGTYKVMVEGTDPLGHKAVASMEVTVNPNPVQPVTWITETVTLTPTADTYINQWAVPWMPPMVGDDGNFIVRGKDIKTALLNFDLSGLRPDAELVSASLKVFATNGKGTVWVGSYALKRPWSEMEATWWEAMAGTKWEQPGANGAADRAPNPTDTQKVMGTGWVAFDVTAIAQEMLQGDAYGIALRGDDAANGGEWYFVSREFPTLQPMLEVTYRYPSR